MQPVLRLIEKVGPSDAERADHGRAGYRQGGRGPLAARHVERADRPLITVNTGGLSEGVFESEMFGHVKGAFTDARSDRVGYFEVAHRGTLFLDEIGNVPMAQQAKLLRVLETGELQPVGSSKTRRVDVRILTATNSELDRAVAEGTFREDLFYRLNTVEVRLPPLRERREDIPLLATHFLAASGAKYGRTGPRTVEYSSGRDVPPFVAGKRAGAPALDRAGRAARRGPDASTSSTSACARRPKGSLSLEDVELDEAERILIRKALTRNRGNVSRAADELGLSRSALYRRLKRHGLQGS